MDSFHTQNLLDVQRVDLDPLVDGFAGVVTELLREGATYVVQQTAEGTGNPLLRFTTTDESLAREVFEDPR